MLQGEGLHPAPYGFHRACSTLPSQFLFLVGDHNGGNVPGEHFSPSESQIMTLDRARMVLPAPQGVLCDGDTATQWFQPF